MGKALKMCIEGSNSRLVKANQNSLYVHVLIFKEVTSVPLEINKFLLERTYLQADCYG